MGSKTFMTIGAENHTDEIRQAEDFYSSDPRAASHIFSKMPEFLSAEKIIEPCAGNGVLADQIKKITGKNVDMYDLIKRRDDINIANYFDLDIKDKYDLIITNPPYKKGTKANPGLVEMILKMLDDVKCNGYVALLLKTLHLESQDRYNRIFSNKSPEKIFVYAPRITCYKNGDMNISQGAISYSWFVWHKQENGEYLNKPTQLGWIEKL